jgi:hypothetical protein
MIEVIITLNQDKFLSVQDRLKLWSYLEALYGKNQIIMIENKLRGII